MRSWIIGLVLVMAAGGACGAAARKGTKQRPWRSTVNAAEPWRNLNGTIEVPERIADGGNALVVLNADAPNISLYISRRYTNDYQAVEGPVVEGLGAGYYWIGATHQLANAYEGHFDWGPVLIQFERPRGRRFYWQLVH